MVNGNPIHGKKPNSEYKLMSDFKIYHLYWEEYPWSEAVKTNFSAFDENKDYGLYQVYGDHHIYGDDTLLYIGKAVEQTFGNRMRGHPDFDACQIAKYKRLHLGYFCDLDDVSQNNWKDVIDEVEPILIKSHMPALNGVDVKVFLDKPNTNILVFNWNERGKLLPEVSNLRNSDYYHDSEKYNFKEMILK